MKIKREREERENLHPKSLFHHKLCAECCRVVGDVGGRGCAEVNLRWGVERGESQGAKKEQRRRKKSGEKTYTCAVIRRGFVQRHTAFRGDTREEVQVKAKVREEQQETKDSRRHRYVEPIQ